MGLVRDYSDVLEFQCLLRKQFKPVKDLKPREVSPSELSDLLANLEREGVNERMGVCVGQETSMSFIVGAENGRFNLYWGINSDVGAESEELAISDAYVVMHPDPRLSFVLLFDSSKRSILMYPYGSSFSQGLPRENAVEYILTKNPEWLFARRIDDFFDQAVIARVREKVIGGMRRVYRNSRFSGVEMDVESPVGGTDYREELRYADSFNPIVSFAMERSPKLALPKYDEKIARKANGLFDKYVPFDGWLEYSTVEKGRFICIAVMLEYPDPE